MSVDLKILRQQIKDSIDREQTAEILTLSGYEINRQFKFSIREERTPSASIRNDGLITDFGDDWSGDIVALLHERRGLSLKDATIYVCDHMGINTGADSMDCKPLPIKRKPQPKSELTQERHSEIMAEMWQFDQNQELKTFKNPDYRNEALAIAPMWLWQQASKVNIALFKEFTTFDVVNKTLVLEIHDYSGKIISYKRRRYGQGKWITAKDTHPNSQCLVSIADSSASVYIVEGHHDYLTAILLGINVLMIPTVGYKTFTVYELSFLQDKTVVFLPDLKRGDSKGMDTMNTLAEQVIEAKSTNVVSVKKILDLIDIPFTRDSIDLSDVVFAWNRDLDGLKSTLLYVGDIGVMLEGEIF